MFSAPMFCEICQIRTFPNWGDGYHVYCELCSADPGKARERHRSTEQSYRKGENTNADHTQKDGHHSTPPPESLSQPLSDAKYAKVLGLSGKVSYSDIKKRWRELAAQYHPDKVSHLGPRLREVAEEEMKEINEARQYFEAKFNSE